MSDITLSSAVRSNLLSLQTTADLMSKTQERLATGLKVNSALDNPTNFFTASSLNSRASDLGRLMDGVSNATQTLEAADNGISAITKLVESAQATARQALQSPATIESPAPATAGTLSGSSFSTLDISTGASTLSAATVDGTAYSTFDESTPSGPAGPAVVTTSANYGSPSAVDLSGGNSLTFNLEVDNSDSPATIVIDAAAVSQLGTVSNTSNVTQGEFVALLNQEFTDAGLDITASAPNVSNINIVTNTNGSSRALEFSAMSSVGGVDTASGMSTLATRSAVGIDLRLPAFLELEIDVDNAGPQTITIDSAAISQFTSGSGTINDAFAITGEEMAALINQEFSDSGVGATATFSTGALSITSNTSGSTSEVDILSVDGNTGTGTGGFIAGVQNGTDTRAADALSFTVDVDGAGSSQTVSIDAAQATTAGFDASALTAENLASLINDDLTGASAYVDSITGQISIASDSTGTSSNVTVSGFSELTTSGGSGLDDGANTGAAVGTTTITNPARAEFVSQYNELMGQIDELAEDAGFNGVNLLDGDDLSVIFNEDGSSTLSISGVDFDSAGLGLGDLGATGLDSNADINAVLHTLSTAIGTLRSQASEFGSNLSIVETREDFTKATINTLETGAANLTLADTNQEGANLLALQTRQSLSSTTLSLASQADQNVLRLF